jgi:hypothetical protein
MSKKYVANKFEITGGTSSDVLLADGTLGSAPSGLELITDEGANTSYRLTNVPASDRDAFSGLVGYNVDVSLNDDRYTNTFTYGAEGNFGFVAGCNNYISGEHNTALGSGNQILETSYSEGLTVMGIRNTIDNYSYGTIVNGFLNTVGVPANDGANGLVFHSTALGAYNSMPQGRGTAMIGMGLLGSSSYTTIVGAGNVDLTAIPATDATSSFLNSTSNPAFIVGIGTVDTTVGGGGISNPTITRANGLSVMRTGDVDFPSLTDTLIDAASDTSAVTKGWVESKVSSVSVTEKHAFTAAQIKALNSAPIDLIPAAGAGTYIRLVMIDWKFNWGTTAFDGTRAQVKWGDNSLVLSAPFFFFETEDRFEGDASSSLLVRQENSKIYLTADADSVLTGDSTLDLYITYQIVTL